MFIFCYNKLKFVKTIRDEKKNNRKMKNKYNIKYYY